MCASCDDSNGRDLQATFGAIVGMEPVVPVKPGELILTDGAECNDCGEEFERVDLTNDYNGDKVCASCFDANSVECNQCDGVVSRDDSFGGPDGNDYCEDCHNDKFGNCDVCEETFANDDLTGIGGITIRVYGHGSTSRRVCVEHACRDCRNEHFVRCEDCNDWVYTEESRSCGDNTLCESCCDNNYFYCEGCSDYVSNDNYCSGTDGAYCTDCRPEEDSDEEDDFAGNRPARVKTGKLERTRSARRFGVELETATCDGWNGLRSQHEFKQCGDGSIDGEEFVSKVLSGDDGLDAITEFSAVAEKAGWTVNNKCGYHLHIDVTNEDVDSLKSICYAYNLTYNVWKRFVSESRRNVHYCGANDWSYSDIADFDDTREFYNWAECVDRYQWFNVAAYAEHKTFEVRLHSGTLNGRKVSNWVVAHLRFVDAVSKMTVAQVKSMFSGKSEQAIFEALSFIWGDNDLTDFYIGRASKFGKTFERLGVLQVA